jgi:23S rRNA (guanosine2251-2'-O)-methyltransferase
VRRLTGFHAIEEQLRSARGPRKEGSASDRLLVAGSGPRIKAILELAAKLGVRAIRCAPEELDRLAPDHRGLILETEGEASLEADLGSFLLDPPGRSLVVALDHVEDPQNFGAILRSADVFAADLVIAPRRRAAPLSEAAVKASAGAAAYVPLALVPNLAESLRALAKAGYWLYAADMGGSPLGEAELPERCVLVLGNEGAGLSRLIRDLCDGILSVPMAGHVDSLNVSAAAAVMMYDYRRRYPAEGPSTRP